MSVILRTAMRKSEIAERNELKKSVDEMQRQKQSFADQLATRDERLEESLEQKSESEKKSKDVDKRLQSAEAQRRAITGQ